MASASGGLGEVTFVSHVQEEGKVIELYDESTHICNLELGKAFTTFTTNTAPRRKWSMRCDGSTLRVFTVPSVGACFELEAEYKLPERRGSRRAAARTRGLIASIRARVWLGSSGHPKYYPAAFRVPLGWVGAG